MKTFGGNSVEFIAHTASQMESDELGGNFQCVNKDTTTLDFWVEKMGFGRGEVKFGEVLNRITGLRDTQD